MSLKHNDMGAAIRNMKQHEAIENNVEASKRPAEWQEEGVDYLDVEQLLDNFKYRIENNVDSANYVFGTPSITAVQ